jgi:glycosyltransferase involved in cell wall biosynthesis
MKYSIVIPTYNHCDDLLKPCIESIFKYTDMTDVELVISANGCFDNTSEYLISLVNQFESIGFANHLKIIWNSDPLGYPRATNEGIKVCIGNRIVLLNNDTILLPQEKSNWLNLLESPFLLKKNCGISAPIISYSPEAGRDFAVFFCVMIDRKVFNKIGLLNEEYGTGAGEDTEFCIEAVNAGFQMQECLPKFATGDIYTGEFPIYHLGEGTMHDTNLVSNWDEKFKENGLRLARKYNREYYKFLLTNNFERHVNLANEVVPPRESARYAWAAEKASTGSVLEIGCSSGFGSQFFPINIEYLGLDYDQRIIDVAKHEFPHRKFEWADINTYELGQYDTIVAFEIIEHLDNGLEVVKKLKQHCKKLLVSVPYKETPGFWGEHHRLHMLDESHLPGFEYTFCDEHGDLSNKPIENSVFNLMLCEYNAE